MTSKIHLPLPSDPSKPLCLRVLSRNATLTIRDWRTMRTARGQVAEGFALSSVKPSKPCRHCLRLAGLLPALKRPPARGEEEEGEEEE